MWDWFSENSIWFLSAAAVGLTVLIFIRNRFRDSVARLKPEQRNMARNRLISRTFLVLMGILLLLVLAAVVAVIFSGEGANSAINTEDIQEWLLTNGIVILAYIIIAYFIYRLVKFFIPKLVIRLVKASGKGRHSKSWFDKRAKTLGNLWANRTHPDI